MGIVKKISFLIIVFFLFTGIAEAEKKPSSAIQTYIDKVLEVFQNYNLDKKTLSPETKKALKKDLSRTAEKIFDFDHMTRKCVGPYWRIFTEKQRKKAVSLFRDLLEERYFAKIQDQLQKVQNWNKENIQVVGEKKLTPEKAFVKTLVFYKDEKFPVNYRLRLALNNWRIYNVIIEGVSLVENYSSQFREVLSRKRPEGFLNQLRNKLATQK